MLSEIRITDLGVIADATLELSDGFTVVTGETGAGKTMVVAGLGLLCGGKADPTRVRPQAEKAVVEGRLHLPPDPELRHALAALDADTDDDGSVIIARTVYAQGRSRGRVGGRSAPVSFLTEVGERLVAVHGQSDQLRLLRPSEQRNALDRFGGEEIADFAAEHRAAFIEWRAVTAELSAYETNAAVLAQEAEFLRHGVTEVEKIAPEPGEDNQLRAESIRLEHAETLRSAVHTAHAALAGDSEGQAEETDVATLLSLARRTLTEQSERDPMVADFERRCEELAALTNELAADLSSYVDSLDGDPLRLATIHERRALLSTLTRTYGSDVDEVLAWAAAASEKLATIDTSEDTLHALIARRDELTLRVSVTAQKLSAARASAAVRFSSSVTEELAGLAMPHARVVAQQTRRDPEEGEPAIEIDGYRVAVGVDGIDEVELCLIAHKGAPPLPLQRGASGGELSRVMLAIEVVFAGIAGHATMVFDEVDSGVGGKAAVEIGRRLARLSRTHQVVAVTHLPQVAAFADHHLVVEKDSAGAITTSGIRPVVGDDRARELARMLAGLEESDAGLAHAHELLAMAKSHTH